MTHKENRLVLPLLALAALLGMGLVAYATRYGPGVGGDATIYLTTARNLMAGKGLGWVDADGSYRLLPYTPPFYPLVLSLIGLVDPEMLVGARWLNIVLFGALIGLTGWYFYHCTGRIWLSALLSGVLAASPVILGVQVWAMSEPLFLFLGCAGLLLLLDYLARPRPVTLVGAALLAGLAFLARYMGVAYVITGGLALLLLGRGEDRRFRVRLGRAEFRAALWYGILAVLPTLAWLIIDFSLTGTVGSRSAQPAEAYWRRFLEIGPALQRIYLFWLLPDSVIPRLPGAMRAALWLVPLAALLGLAYLLVKRLNPMSKSTRASTPGAPAVRLVQLFGLFCIVYLVVLAVVQVFTFPPITLASRMLSPVHFAVLVLLFGLLYLALVVFAPQPSGRLHILWAAVFLGCLALFGTYTLRSALIARDYHQSGIGYMSPAWQASETIARARQLPAGVPIISNDNTALMFLAGRPAYVIQEMYQDRPQEQFTTFGTGDDPGQRAFREQGGALILFKGALAEDFAMYGDQVDARLQALTSKLFLYYEGSDGAIYFYQRPDF